MRRILIGHARRKHRARRVELVAGGGDADELLALDEALARLAAAGFGRPGYFKGKRTAASYGTVRQQTRVRVSKNGIFGGAARRHFVTSGLEDTFMSDEGGPDPERL